MENLADAAPPQGFSIRALTRVFQVTDSVWILAALRDAGKLEEVLDIIPPEPASKAILASQLLVGVEATLLVVIENWEDIERLVRDVLDDVDRLLGFDLSAISRIKDRVAEFPELIDALELSLGDSFNEVRELALELDQITAEAQAQADKFAEEAIDLVQRVDGLVPELVSEAKKTITDARSVAGRALESIRAKAEETKAELSRNVVKLAEEL